MQPKRRRTGNIAALPNGMAMANPECLCELANCWFGSEAVILQQIIRTAAARSEPAAQRCFRGNVKYDRQPSRRAAVHSSSWRTTAVGHNQPFLEPRYRPVGHPVFYYLRGLVGLRPLAQCTPSRRRLDSGDLFVSIAFKVFCPELVCD